MKNKLTKYFISVTALLLLTMPVCFAEPQTTDQPEQSAVVEQTATQDTAQEQTQQEQVDTAAVEVKDTENTADTIQSQTVEPDHKREIKHVLGKFLKTMLLVIGSCLAIFLLLLGYKKIKSPKVIIQNNIDIQKNLNSPETIDEATKFFIEKF